MTIKTRLDKLEEKANPKRTPQIKVHILWNPDRSPLTDEQIAEAKARVAADANTYFIKVRYATE